MVRVSVLGILVTILTVLVPGGARADDAVRLDVAVGETVERDVGFAIGLQCDDLTIIRADLRTTTPESNTFVVTGVAEGITRCRAGTAPNRPTYLFEIHVVPARRRR
ncbi:MAG TPA: hypothetical protein VFK02_29870 [Kofleriaceae bacterium]|nr:hypothetical protein [Kofleriaceae bacterium]